MRSNRWLVVLAISGFAFGCTSETPPVVATPAKAKAVAAKPVAPVKPAEPKPAETEIADAPSPTVEKADSAPEALAVAEPLTYGVERIIIFAPQNPLIVELRLSIDGQPHVAALDQLVEHALQLADMDGDGRAMWKELTASPRFKYGQFGNLPIDGDNGPKQIVERYDIDRDGVVDTNELPRFLTRNAGGSRPFSIRGTIDDSPSGRRESPLWQLLDVDGNGRLSGEEIVDSATRLRSRDADDDEILNVAELMPPSSAMPGAMMPARRRGGREGGRLLGDHAQWDAVRTALEEQYALGGSVEEDDFPFTPQLFAVLDGDADGRVRRKEIERLNAAPPDVILSVNLRTLPTADAAGQDEQEAEAAAETAASDSTEKPMKEPAEEAASGPAKPPPRIELVAFSEDLQGEKSATPLPGDRLLVRAAGASLLIYLNDTLAAADYAQRAEQGLAMFDGDKNGYLEASEVNGQAQAIVGRFEAVDTDEDGKVFAGEIATYLEQQQQALRSQMHARVEGEPDGLCEALDQNDDGRIDARETEAAGDRLRSLDRDGDGEIDLDEIPAGLVPGIARGNLENQDALFMLPPSVQISPSTDAPRWFQQTDANRDGSISPREFLGPIELFEKLDANGDGFLTAGEAGT